MRESAAQRVVLQRAMDRAEDMAEASQLRGSLAATLSPAELARALGQQSRGAGPGAERLEGLPAPGPWPTWRRGDDPGPGAQDGGAQGLRGRLVAIPGLGGGESLGPSIDAPGSLGAAPEPEASLNSAWQAAAKAVGVAVARLGDLDRFAADVASPAKALELKRLVTSARLPEVCPRVPREAPRGRADPRDLCVVPEGGSRGCDQGRGAAPGV